MATVYMTNSTKRLNTVPTEMEDVNQAHGRFRVAYDEHTFTAELTAGDILVGPKIPKGAQVYNVVVHSQQLGSAGGNGELDCGWSAGTNGDEAADADGFIPAIEVGSAFANTDMEAVFNGTTTPAGEGKQFVDEVNVQFTANDTTDAATTKTIKTWVYYALD